MAIIILIFNYNYNSNSNSNSNYCVCVRIYVIGSACYWTHHDLYILYVIWHSRMNIEIVIVLIMAVIINSII